MTYFFRTRRSGAITSGSFFGETACGSMSVVPQ